MNQDQFKRMGQDIARDIQLPDVPPLREQELLAAMQVPQPKTKQWLWLAVPSVAACAFALLLLWPQDAEFWVGNVTLAGRLGQTLHTESTSKTIGFSGGTRLELKAKSTAAVTQADRRKVVVTLSHGGIRATVNRGGKTWTVAAGPYRVTVVGTKFDVHWSGQQAQLEVSVQKGLVRVSGGEISGGAIELRPGQRLSVEGSNLQLGDVIPTPSKVEALTEPEPILPPRKRRKPVKKTAVNSLWRELYASGQFAKAYAQAVAERSFSDVNMSAKDLWALGTIARLQQDAARSNKALRKLRRDHPTSRHAKDALYVLGRVALELQLDAQQGARWFERYLAQAGNKPLAEEALGRLLEARNSLGESRKAKKIAKRYLEAYPNGSFRDRAREVLAP